MCIPTHPPKPKPSAQRLTGEGEAGRRQGRGDYHLFVSTMCWALCSHIHSHWLIRP